MVALLPVPRERAERRLQVDSSRVSRPRDGPGDLVWRPLGALAAGPRRPVLNYWLEGKAGRGGKVHRPVIRVEPKGAGAAPTWAEFVEAGLLRQYRRELKVPLPELRASIDLLRERFDVPYPLADRRPYASGKALVLQVRKGPVLQASRGS